MAENKGHKWFAALYDRIMASAERGFLKAVRREVAGGAKGRVLEIGAGTGLNFAHYSDSAEVIATEPDPFMLQTAEKRAAEANHPIDVRQASAEELPFEDASFDVVVGTLVMCSVPHPDRALAEIKRVLKPGGEYRFYEHVRYGNAFAGFCQDVATPVWRWFGAGCHPNRDTAQSIRDAGLDIVEIERTKPLPPIPPMILSRPHIKGVAIRK